MVLRLTDKSLLLLARFGSQGVRLGATIVLARLISPQEYGRFELVAAVPGFLAAAGDFGISRSINNSPDLPEDEVRDTALFMLSFFAVLFAALSVAGGWYFDRQLDDPRLRWVGAIFAASLVAQVLQGFQLSLLARNLRFSRWALAEVVTILASVATSVTIAVMGGGIYALAFQQLFAASAGLLLTLPIQPLHWPRRVTRRVIRRFVSFGWRMSIFQYMNNVPSSIIRLLVGWRSGPESVGIYGRAVQFRDLIGHNLASTFDLVLVPLMAQSHDQPARLRDLLLRGCVGLTTFCAFGAAWVVVAGPDLIRVLLGSNWAEVPPLLTAIAPGIVAQGMAYSHLFLALALRRTEMPIRYSILSLLALVGAAGVYELTDLWYFVLSLSLLQFFPTAYASYRGVRMTGLSARLLLRHQSSVLFIALASCIGMWAVRHGLMMEEDWLSRWTVGLGAMQNFFIVAIRLLVTTLAGLAIAWLLLARWDRLNYRLIVSLMLRPKASRSADVSGTDTAID